MIVTSLVTLITVEMNLIVLCLDVLEAERFVPALREHIERDLPTYAKLQIQVLQLLLESSHECLTNLVLVIILLKGISFLSAAVPADWADVHHTIPILKESTSKN